jgi:hypothetical protein
MCVYAFGWRWTGGGREWGCDIPRRSRREGSSLLCEPFSWRPVRMSVWRQTPAANTNPAVRVCNIFAASLRSKPFRMCVFDAARNTRLLVVFTLYHQVRYFTPPPSSHRLRDPSHCRTLSPLIITYLSRLRIVRRLPFKFDILRQCLLNLEPFVRYEGWMGRKILVCTIVWVLFKNENTP